MPAATDTRALDRRLSVAPMMACTDRHCRYLLRLITRRTLLYTEMIVAGAICRGDAARLLARDPAEHPVAVQIGGADPREMAAAAAIAAASRYDEIDMNVGCPSERVRSGRFGAALMTEPQRVADCVRAMRDAVRVPVTVKTRIGVDDRDSYAALVDFVGTVAAAGCEVFAVHARKAWLAGLSPRENRELPPLRHDVVLRLKRDFPHLGIVLNGGVADLDTARRLLAGVDGVMIGRAAYRAPYLLADADRAVFGDPRTPPSRREVVRAMLPYLERELARGVRLATMTRHMLGLFQGVPGARRWRRTLGEGAHRPGAGVELVERALAAVADGLEAAA